MSSNLFKRLYYPNADGSNSATLLTNTNTAFVHTYIGDDSTGDGTRQYPYRSVGQALLKAGISYIVFRGVVNEPIYSTKTILGDDINQFLCLSQYSCTIFMVRCATIDSSLNLSPFYNIISYSWDNLIIDNFGKYSGSWAADGITYSLFKNYAFVNYTPWQPTFNIDNDTINKLTVEYSSDYGICYSVNNSIIVSEYVNWYRSGQATSAYGHKFTNCVFSSTCVFKHYNATNGTLTITPYNDDLVTPAVFGNDSVDNVRLIKNGYRKALSAWYSADVVNRLFYSNPFGIQSCKIIKEIKDGGTHPNIFNKYNVDGSVADWTLNPDPLNEALWASNTGGYVGCFKPSFAINSTSGNPWQTVINVNSDGTDTVTAGTLLLKNSDDTLSFANNPINTSQTWNRLKSNTTINIPVGRNFNGIECLSQDGSPFGYYFGKYQNLIDVIEKTPTDALEVGAIYKVCNLVHDVTKSIIYGPTSKQYLPDYFIKCVAGYTTFSLTNVDSGTVLKKLLSTPLESVELIPYDDMTTESTTYPRFSCPLSGNTLMLQYSATNGYGKTVGTPVLFGDSSFCTELAAIKDKISYYNGYAVTNADQEFYTLAQNSKFITALPVLRYFRVELNAHFNLSYDY